MPDDICPSREILLAYRQGSLSEDLAKGVVAHLLQCAACQAVIGTPNHAERTAAAQRRPLAQDDQPPDEPQCQEAAAKANVEIPVPDKFGRDDSRPAIAVPPAGKGAKHEPSGGGKPPSESPSPGLGGWAESGNLPRWGEYQLLEKCAEGGMGAVYKAWHCEMERIVAVKVLPSTGLLNDAARVRFDREIKAIGRLNHPNIVRAYDARKVQDVPFLVMEYLDGLDLSNLVERYGPLPIPDACELARQAAVGLECAHQHRLVHRDIKPSNLMLTGGDRPSASSSPSAGGYVVKILDLGLALLPKEETPGQEVTTPNRPVGTVDYMAPEQFSDSHGVDIRADLYSLGCTLYKLMTGCTPFPDPPYKSFGQKMDAHLHKPIPLEPLAERGVPEPLTAILVRLMAKAPSDRYATPADVAAALKPWAAGSDLAALVAEISDAVPRGSRKTKADHGADTVSCASRAANVGPHADTAWPFAQPYRRRLVWTAVGLALAGVFAALFFGFPRPVKQRDGEQNNPISTRQDLSVQGVPRPDDGKVIQPWFPGATPNDTPPEPPPGPPPVFTREDLHQFLVKTLKPTRTPQLWRMLYTEIATTVDREQVGTWRIGSAMTNDGNACEIVVRTGAWFPRFLTPREAAEIGLQPTGSSRNVTRLWRLPIKELVSLQQPELSVVEGAGKETRPPPRLDNRRNPARGEARRLVGRIRCVASDNQRIEHLALVMEFPSNNQDAISTLYQQYRITELPSGWLEVDRELDATINVKHGTRLYLQAFLARPEAGFFRISNELLWTKEP